MGGNLMPLWSTGIQTGTRAAQPTPNAKQAGTLYWVTDEEVLERWSGSAWAAYSATGGGLETGTSFPGSPTTGDRYRRSNLDYMVFFYDGTRWLSEQQFTSYLSTKSWDSTYTATGHVARGGVPWNGVYGLWVERVEFGYRIVTTNSGSAYWTFGLTYSDAADASDTSVGTAASTAALANDHGWNTIGYDADIALGASAATLQGTATKVGSPGYIQVPSVHFTYRLIAT